jgi:hypothetical protein
MAEGVGLSDVKDEPSAVAGGGAELHLDRLAIAKRFLGAGRLFAQYVEVHDLSARNLPLEVLF